MGNAVRNVSPIKTVKKYKTSFILLCAGEANRMKSHGPIPLIRVTPELNLIQHQISIIKECIAIPEIIGVFGYEADKIMNNTSTDFVKVHNENYASSNIMRSIGLGLRASTADRALIIYGDLLFNRETLANAKLEESCLFTDRAGLFCQDSIGCTFNEQNVAEQLLYELPNKWVQIAYVMGREFNLLKSIAWNREKDKLFGFEAMNEIINKNGILHDHSPKNMKIIDIDSSKDLANIKKVI